MKNAKLRYTFVAVWEGSETRFEKRPSKQSERVDRYKLEHMIYELFLTGKGLARHWQMNSAATRNFLIQAHLTLFSETPIQLE